MPSCASNQSGHIYCPLALSLYLSVQQASIRNMVTEQGWIPRYRSHSSSFCRAAHFLFVWVAAAERAPFFSIQSHRLPPSHPSQGGRQALTTATLCGSFTCCLRGLPRPQPPKIRGAERPILAYWDRPPPSVVVHHPLHAAIRHLSRSSTTVFIDSRHRVAHRHCRHPCVVVASSHCLIAYRAIVVYSWHPIAIALAWPPVALSTSIASHRGSSLAPLQPLHSTCRLLQLWQRQPFVGRQLIAATFRLLSRALWPPRLPLSRSPLQTFSRSPSHLLFLLSWVELSRKVPIRKVVGCN